MQIKDTSVRRGDSAARIYADIRRKILSLELQPGAAIDEAALVRDSGASRTPVREALVRLASDGLVILLPNRGSQVAPLDLARIRDYLEAIDICQRAVTIWAAVRRRTQDVVVIRERAAAFEAAAAANNTDAMVLANRAFHQAIADACGNRMMATAYERILDEGLRVSRFSLGSIYRSQDADSRAFVDIIIQEHAGMVHAIETGDTALADQLAASHTVHTRARFAGFLADTLAPVVKIDANA
jgi:DNA-binding GntR family transcriptional regulator